jgi:hypothetical protein
MVDATFQLAGFLDFAGVFFVLAIFFGFWAWTGNKSMPVCPRCHEVNRHNAIYCSQCGRQLRD